MTVGVVLALADPLVGAGRVVHKFSFLAVAGTACDIAETSEKVCVAFARSVSGAAHEATAVPGAHTLGSKFEIAHAGLLACHTGPERVADALVALSVSVYTLALTRCGCVRLCALAAISASVKTVRAVAEARARPGVETHAVFFARGVVSARAF